MFVSIGMSEIGFDNFRIAVHCIVTLTTCMAIVYKHIDSWVQRRACLIVCNTMCHTCTVEMDRCDQPNTIDNGIVTSTKDVLLPGDMISYTCEKGYMLSGQEKRYCLRNGNWSEEQPKCLGKVYVKKM